VLLRDDEGRDFRITMNDHTDENPNQQRVE